VPQLVEVVEAGTQAAPHWELLLLATATPIAATATSAAPPITHIRGLRAA
jgi:hypothetical protein